MIAPVLVALALLLLIPVGVLIVQVVAASIPAPSRLAPAPIERPAIAVLMPAHNEAAGIDAAIRNVSAQLVPGDRVVVVADNCDDDTAAVAMRAGAEVLTRSDRSARGKSYALDFGVRALQAAPPAIVIILDADCLVREGALALIATQAMSSQRPVQASYLMHAPAGSTVRVRFAEFAWAFKSRGRAAGYWRLGLPCHLQGSGMAFPWAIIAAAPLASGHIAEDLQLGLDLALRGQAPLFCPAARVTSEFPTSTKGLQSQRIRWEHGHLATIAASAPRLLWRSLMTGNIGLAALAIDLCVPPLAFLVLLLSAMLVVTGGALLMGSSALAFELSLFNLAALTAVICFAWYRFGRPILSFLELLTVPIQVLRKIAIYRKFFGRRQKEWVRTERD
jgi:cellulose synthase/poly-beta-1,6-N-acetylglucosamine synthase-like glycosyltransferase